MGCIVNAFLINLSLKKLNDTLLYLLLSMSRSSKFDWGNFKILKSAPGQFIPNYTPKHVITSTNFGR